MMLIDSHCHIDFEQFAPDRAEVLSRCLQHHVDKIIVPGVIAKTWTHLLDVCQQSEQLFPALGLHPMFMAQHQAQDITLLIDYIDTYQPIAVGEIGLDFYIPGHDKPSQITLFEQQLKIAADHDLPVILHVRKAHDQVLLLLRKYPLKGGIIHAFNGSQQQAQLYIQLGFLLGVGGAISYDRATRLRTLFAELPLSALVLETDAPDMPLQGQDKTRNSPEFIPHILAALATLRSDPSESTGVIAHATTDNVQTLFAI
jgi:TatD DNase family protein